MMLLNYISSLHNSSNIKIKLLFYTFMISSTMSHPYCNKLWVSKSVKYSQVCSQSKLHEVCRKSAWWQLCELTCKICESASAMKCRCWDAAFELHSGSSKSCRWCHNGSVCYFINGPDTNAGQINRVSVQVKRRMQMGGETVLMA